MQPLIDHARFFRGQSAARPEECAPLAEDRSPQDPFATGSGPRAVPAPALGARPGDLSGLLTAGGSPAPRASDPAVTEAVRNHVLTLLPRPYPSAGARRRSAAGRPRPHGRLHEVRTGSSSSHGVRSDSFEAL